MLTITREIPLWGAVLIPSRSLLVGGDKKGRSHLQTLEGDTVSVLNTDCLKGYHEVLSDGKRLVVGTTQRDISLYDLDSSKLINTLPSNYSKSIASSPDGNYLAVPTTSSVLQIWDLRMDKLLRTLNEQVVALQYSPDGQYLALSTSGKGIMQLKKTTDYRTVFSIIDRPYQCAPDWLTFSPDSRYLALDSWMCDIKIWNVAKVRHVRTLATSCNNWMRAVTYSPDGTHLICGSTAPYAFIMFNVATEKVIFSTGCPKSIARISCSTSGEHILASSSDQVAHLWKRT